MARVGLRSSRGAIPMLDRSQPRSVEHRNCLLRVCFGPRSPWGLVNLSGSANMSIGMDSAWYVSFMEAYFESMAATELPIWRVFKQHEEEPYPGIPIT